MTTRIPSVYHYFFKWFDPLVCLHGAYLFFFDRDTVVRSFIPDSPRNPLHDMLFYEMGGNMLCLGALSAVMLRVTNDVKVWTVFQAAELMVDVAMFWGIFASLTQQNRLSIGALRWEDWAVMAITGAAGTMRTLFLLRVGFGKNAPGKAGKRKH